jgi:hypothetical protein
LSTTNSAIKIFEINWFGKTGFRYGFTRVVAANEHSEEALVIFTIREFWHQEAPILSSLHLDCQ